MVYVCSICGHVYDEAKEEVPFAQLPDDWTCPSCGAEKAMFDPVTDDDGQEEVVEAEAHKLEKLPSALLATIFSNFERACRKQYDEESAKLFHELSLALAPAAGEGTPDDLAAMVDEDISKLYPALKSLCAGKRDRGALRALTWGEKVRYAGQLCYIHGRRSSGYFDIRRPDGTRVHAGVHYRHLTLVERANTNLIYKEVVEVPPSGRA